MLVFYNLQETSTNMYTYLHGMNHFLKLDVFGKMFKILVIFILSSMFLSEDNTWTYDGGSGRRLEKNA
jgi:hypothetical protein